METERFKELRNRSDYKVAARSAITAVLRFYRNALEDKQFCRLFLKNSN